MVLVSPTSESPARLWLTGSSWAFALGLVAAGSPEILEQLGVGQRRLHDEPRRGAEARITGRERQLVGEDVVDDRRVTRRDHEALGGVVDEDTLQRGDHDGVADLDRVEVVERVAVRGPVTGHRSVARLAWERRSRVVARTLAEVRRVRAFDDDLIETDHRDPDVADRVALGRGSRMGRSDGGPRRQLVERRFLGQRVANGAVVGLVLQLGAQAGLRARLLHRRAPDLVRRKEEEENSEPDQDSSEDVGYPP